MANTNRIKYFFEVMTSLIRISFEYSNTDDMLQELANTITQVMEAKGCTLRAINSTNCEFQVRAATGLSQTYLDIEKEMDDTTPYEIFENSLEVIEDVAKDNHIQYPDAALDEGIVTVIGLPFQVTENLHMLLRIYFDKKVEITPEDRYLFYYLAYQISIAIKNSIQRNSYLEAFRGVSSAIHEGQQVSDILENIVYSIQEIMDSRGCIYWIVDTELKQVYMKVTSGFQLSNLSHIDYDTLHDIFSLYNDKEVFFHDVRDDSRIPSSSKLGKQMVVSVLGIPFEIVDKYKGILAVYFSNPRSMTQSEIHFVRDCGRQGAIALHKAFRYDENMLQAFRETIEGLVLTLEAKDVSTHCHSLNVANYAKLTAKYMNLPERDVGRIYRGGLLHDIGKIALQDDILYNLGRLSSKNVEIVKKHPQLGSETVKRLSLLNEVTPMVLYHHERYDGTGYPDGLEGEAIPLDARIIAVCDTFDAMTSERPHMGGISIFEALNVLQEKSGTKFDSEVIEAFVRAIEENIEEVQPFPLKKKVCGKEKAKSGSKNNWMSQLSEMMRRFI